MKVGYQGIPGCYSEGALISLFKDQVFINNFQKFDQLETLGFSTFEILFNELLVGNLEFGLLPVESNLAGSFHSVLDMIANSPVSIQGEIKHSESCCLLGCPESITGDIREIRAQDLLLGQCVKFINSLKGCKITLAGDTAQAAQELSMDKSNSVAVIGGKRAAKMYGLKVLEENIQDENLNVTRFFLVSKARLSTNLIPRHLNPCTFVIANCKSTTGAFFRALSCFSLRDINVSKIESRASNRSLALARPWEYLLYIELDGSIGSSNVLNAIENLKEYCQSVNVVGSFPRYQPLVANEEEFMSGIDSLRTALSRPPITVPNLRRDSTAAKLMNDLESKISTQEIFSKYSLHPDFYKKYDIDYELGRGGFGFVVAGHRIDDDHPVAIKFIFKNKVNPDSWVKDPVYGVIPLEVYILRHCSHPNIIRFQDYYDYDPFCYLVMDLHGSHWHKSHSPSIQSRLLKVTPPAQKTKTISAATLALSDLSIHSSTSLDGSLPKSPEKPTLTRGMTMPFPAQLQRRPSMDLFECIEENNRLEEKDAAFVFRQVVSAVKYLHDRGIIHRDIKDENIVIDHDMNVQLIDFGSASLEDKSKPYFDRFQGTVMYCPPEVLRGEKYKGKPADVWCLGNLLYTIICGESPFYSSDQVRKWPYRKPKVPLSREVLFLLDLLLQKSPESRPTADQILDHIWINPLFPYHSKK